jgi:hypothetical protein
MSASLSSMAEVAVSGLQGLSSSKMNAREAPLQLLLTRHPRQRDALHYIHLPTLPCTCALAVAAAAAAVARHDVPVGDKAPEVVNCIIEIPAVSAPHDAAARTAAAASEALRSIFTCASCSMLMVWGQQGCSNLSESMQLQLTRTHSEHQLHLHGSKHLSAACNFTS